MCGGACGVERVGSSFSPALFGERKEPSWKRSKTSSSSTMASQRSLDLMAQGQKRPSKLSSSRLKIYRQKMANEALEAEGHSSTTSRSFVKNDASRATSHSSKENEDNKKLFARQPFRIGGSSTSSRKNPSLAFSSTSRSSNVMSTSSRRKSALPAIAASSSSAFTSTSSFMSSDTIHSSSAMSTSSLKNPSVALSDTSHSSFTSSAAFRRKARKDHYEKKAEQRELQRLNGVGEDGTDSLIRVTY